MAVALAEVVRPACYLVTDLADLEYVEKNLEAAKDFSLDTEYVDWGYPKLDLVGISLSWDGKTGVYIPVGHEQGPQLPVEVVIEHLKPFLEDPSRKMYFHNVKADAKSLGLYGVNLHHNVFDSMLASWLLDNTTPNGLKECSARELHEPMVELKEFAKKEKHPTIPRESVVRSDKTKIEDMLPYAAADAVQTYKLGKHFERKIEEAGLSKVYYELELPIAWILTKSEQVGFYIDAERLREIGVKIEDKVHKEIEPAIFQLAGREFNLNSTTQLNKVLFDELKLKPTGEKNKKGEYPTDREALEVLAKQHEIAKHLILHRTLEKLKGTYVDGILPRLVNGRLHGTFHQHVTDTGRLSSVNPNMQNIPARDKGGIKVKDYPIRACFAAPPGKKLVVADYAQLEPRIMAHLSHDENLINIFKNKIDLYGAVAVTVFNLDCQPGEVKKLYKDKRDASKVIVLAIMYGQGPRSLAKEIDSTEKEAKAFIESFFERYPKVRAWINYQHNFVRKHGYVQTITGRRRYLPTVYSDEMAQVAGALRQAQNSPIQGSAADIVKIAMRNIQRKFDETGIGDRAVMLVQVHDEIVTECDEDIAEQVKKIMVHEMEHAVNLRVPLISECGIGDNWLEAKV